MHFLQFRSNFSCHFLSTRHVPGSVPGVPRTLSHWMLTPTLRRSVYSHFTENETQRGLNSHTGTQPLLSISELDWSPLWTPSPPLGHVCMCVRVCAHVCVHLRVRILGTTGAGRTSTRLLLPPHS